MGFRRLFSFIVLSFAISGISFSVAAQHEEPVATEEHAAVDTHGEAAGKKKFKVSEVLFPHIADSHYWHLFDWKGEPVAAPLPVMLYDTKDGFHFFSASHFHHGHEAFGDYKLTFGMKEKIALVNPEEGRRIFDFSLTKNVLSMFLGILILFLLIRNAVKKYKTNGDMKAPSGFQNALEVIIIFLRDEVAIPNLGKKYLKYFPLLLTIFFFIWINNLLGLLPGGANFTGNIAVTACLALVSFVVIMASSNKHYWGHLFNPPGVPLGIKFLVVPIEIMSMFIKPLALMIRLFANMMAGHIVILSVISMIFIFAGMNQAAGWGFAPLSLAFSIFMFLLELLVASIQAFIFANLTAVFIGQAIEEPEHHIEHPVSIEDEAH